MQIRNIHYVHYVYPTPLYVANSSLNCIYHLQEYKYMYTPHVIVDNLQFVETAIHLLPIPIRWNKAFTVIAITYPSYSLVPSNHCTNTTIQLSLFVTFRNSKPSNHRQVGSA